jgi:hypothetical protein
MKFEPAPEELIRLVDSILEDVAEADRNLDDAWGILMGLDAERKWDGYIIGQDSPLTIAAVVVANAREELNRLALDLRSLGVPGAKAVEHPDIVDAYRRGWADAKAEDNPPEAASG